MRRHLEFHDSELLSIERGAGSVWLDLEAYVHQWERIGASWRGAGYVQPIRITLQDAAPPAAGPLPQRICSGALRIDGRSLPSLVQLPFSSTRAAGVTLELADGQVLVVDGAGVQIRSTGDARYVEELPADFRPDDC